MEGGRHGLEPELRARDVDGLDHAPGALGGERQQAVVGADQDPVVRQPQRDRAALGADVRVDDRQVHAHRHVQDRALQDQRAGANVVALDAVGQIDDRAPRAQRRDHAVADPDEVVGRARSPTET